MVSQRCKYQQTSMGELSVSFEGETNRSIPHIDGDEAKAEWRFFRKVLFRV